MSTTSGPVPAAASAHELVAGAACLDFANTLGPRRPGPDDEQRDYVPTYDALLDWCVRADLLTRSQARRLRSAAAADPQRARAVHAEAASLREATYEVFEALVRRHAVPPSALARLRAAYLRALERADLAVAGGSVGWRWPTEAALEQPLWVLARSAVELASAASHGRVKECPGDDGHCGWLFLDTSKNATRRWCSMASCGARAKSRSQATRRRDSRRRSA